MGWICCCVKEPEVNASLLNVERKLTLRRFNVDLHSIVIARLK